MSYRKSLVQLAFVAISLILSPTVSSFPLGNQPVNSDTGDPPEGSNNTGTGSSVEMFFSVCPPGATGCSGLNVTLSCKGGFDGLTLCPIGELNTAATTDLEFVGEVTSGPPAGKHGPQIIAADFDFNAVGLTVGKKIVVDAGMGNVNNGLYQVLEISTDGHTLVVDQNVQDQSADGNDDTVTPASVTVVQSGTAYCRAKDDAGTLTGEQSLCDYETTYEATRLLGTSAIVYSATSHDFQFGRAIVDEVAFSSKCPPLGTGEECAVVWAVPPMQKNSFDSKCLPAITPTYPNNGDTLFFTEGIGGGGFSTFNGRGVAGKNGYVAFVDGASVREDYMYDCNLDSNVEANTVAVLGMNVILESFNVNSNGTFDVEIFATGLLASSLTLNGVSPNTVVEGTTSTLATFQRCDIALTFAPTLDNPETLTLEGFFSDGGMPAMATNPIIATDTVSTMGTIPSTCP